LDGIIAAGMKHGLFYIYIWLIAEYVEIVIHAPPLLSQRPAILMYSNRGSFR